MRIKENTNNTDYAGALTFQTRAQGSTPVERMRIDSSGNVGIGSTDPECSLTTAVSTSTVYSTSLPTTGGNPDGTEVAYFENTDNSSTNFKYALQAFRVGAGTGQSNVFGRFGFARTGASTGAFVWHIRNLGGAGTTATQEAMRLDSSGRVGIGENNPQHKIDIQGASSGINIDGGGTNPYINLVEAGDTGFQISYDGASTNDFLINSGFSGSLTTNRLTLTRDEGNLTITGGMVAPGAHRIGTHKYYKQNWWFGGSTDLSWKKIADVTLASGSYSSVSFLVKYINASSNFGASVSYEVEQYTVMCGRSNATADGMNYGLVRGPYNDRVRAFKTATGVYEIQVRQYLNYRHIGIEIQAHSDLKATITYAGSTLSNGSTSGTAYVPTGENIQGFTESTTARGLFKVNDSSGNQKIRVDSDGLKFNSDTAAANALDDYEEGTWTPVLTGTTSGTKNLAGKYTKIGNKVTIRIGHWTAISSGTINGNAYITGLPFTPATNPWGNNAGIASYGLAHIRGQTSIGTANAPWAMIDASAIRLHDSGNLGNSIAYSGQAATWPASRIAQNGSTSVIIDWVFTYLTT